MSDRILIYPCDREVLSLFENRNIGFKLKVDKLISPIGWGLVGTTIIIDGEKKYVEEKYSENLDVCEILWIVNTRLPLSFENNILPMIKEAVSKEKQVIITRTILEQDRVYLETYIKEKKVSIPQTDSGISYEKNKIFNLTVPIIFVAGLGESVDKCTTQMKITEQLRVKGYKVTLISSREESILFEHYTIPRFLFETKYSERDKILKFNFFLKKIEQIENPDIIIIGIPGSVLPISQSFVEYFGICAFEIGQAVKPDCVILNVMYGDYTEEELLELGEKASARFGMQIDFYNIVDKMLEIEESKREQQFITLTLDKEFVSKKKKEIFMKEKFFHLSEENEVSKIADEIVELLAGFGQVQTM